MVFLSDEQVAALKELAALKDEVHLIAEEIRAERRLREVRAALAECKSVVVEA